MARRAQECRGPRLAALAAWTLALLLVLAGSAGAAPALQDLALRLNIDPAQVTVSGISSGGFMAQQLHVAHSAHIGGIGVVAGGPYGCSQGDMGRAVSVCSKWASGQCQGSIAAFTPFDPALCRIGYRGPVSAEDSQALARQSFALAQAAAAAGRIDDPRGLARARVYLFSGALDELVPYAVMDSVRGFYADADKGAAADVTFNRLFTAHHTMVTDNVYRVGAGAMGACGAARPYGDPYISDCRQDARRMLADNDCGCREGAGEACPPTKTIVEACRAEPGRPNFDPAVTWPDAATCQRNVRAEACRDAAQVDLAGAILRALYPDIAASSRTSLLAVQPASAGDAATSDALSRRIARFSQAAFVRSSFGAADQQAWASLAEDGYLYIPPACEDGGRCRLHVALHGCKQGGENDLPYGNLFAKYAGYNEWAKENGIVVLYPQAAPTMLAPLNPEGCWDWWGYTGPDFATQQGRQVKAIAQMINVLVRAPLLPVPAGD